MIKLIIGLLLNIIVVYFIFSNYCCCMINSDSPQSVLLGLLLAFVLATVSFILGDRFIKSYRDSNK